MQIHQEQQEPMLMKNQYHININLRYSNNAKEQYALANW